METHMEAELKRRIVALQEQSQQQISLATELEKTANVALNSELKQKGNMIEDMTEKCEDQSSWHRR
eukprot:3948611-Prorocentrum_lima.AAC.1